MLLFTLRYLFFVTLELYEPYNLELCMCLFYQSGSLFCFRYRKCNAAYGVIMQIRNNLDKRQNIQGKVGNIFREIQILMNNLD